VPTTIFTISLVKALKFELSKRIKIFLQAAIDLLILPPLDSHSTPIPRVIYRKARVVPQVPAIIKIQVDASTMDTDISDNMSMPTVDSQSQSLFLAAPPGHILQLPDEVLVDIVSTAADWPKDFYNEFYSAACSFPLRGL
jgi:hypothetical protein